MRRDTDWLVDEPTNAPPGMVRSLSNGGINDGRPMPPNAGHYQPQLLDNDLAHQRDELREINHLDANLNHHVYSNSNFHHLYQANNQAAQSAPQLLQPLSPLTNGDGMTTQNSQMKSSPCDVDMNATSPEYTNGDVAEDEFEYHRVILTRSEAGFGFRIVGGAEEGRNVAIGSIVIGGVASIGK